ATPLTAAVAALVISANPQLAAREVMSVLRRTASRDLSMLGYVKTPAAPFDSNTNWDVSPIAPFDSGSFTDVGDADGTWSPWFGCGRVDAAAAVAEALRLAGEEPVPSRGPFRYDRVPHLSIPDDSAIGVRDSLDVVDDGTITGVLVTLDIEH